jgi:phosphate-selective porin OprO/OprP
MKTSRFRPGLRPAVPLLCALLGAAAGPASAAEDGGPVRISHGPGFTLATADGAFSLTPYGYGQVRYTLTGADGDTNTSAFTVKRARLGFKGNAYGPDLTYRLYLNVYSGKADASVGLFDLFADYRVGPRLSVKGGQYKVPYAVQWNVSAAGLQFVERGAVDAYFRLDRDTGVTAHGRLGQSVAYDLGVFNGEGTNKTNPDTHHLWVARLKATPEGPFPGHESDNERSAAPRLLLVAGAAYDDRVAAHSVSALNARLDPGALGPSDLLAVNLYAGAKHHGREVQAEYHRRYLDPVAPGTRTETAEGLRLQGGAFLSRNVEAAARYEYLDPNTHIGGDLVREAGVAVNRFFAGHRSKLQADLFRVTTQTAPGMSGEDFRLRVQYQIAF